MRVCRDPYKGLVSGDVLRAIQRSPHSVYGCRTPAFTSIRWLLRCVPYTVVCCQDAALPFLDLDECRGPMARQVKTRSPQNEARRVPTGYHSCGSATRSPARQAPGRRRTRRGPRRSRRSCIRARSRHRTLPAWLPTSIHQAMRCPINIAPV